MTPTKKIATMLYQTQQAQRLLDQQYYNRATIFLRIIENTAIRWGPPEIKELCTKAWQQIKDGDYKGARETLEEIEDLLEGMLET